MENLSVAIQAGGMSMRMGRDKGLLPFGDTTLVEFILRQVWHLSKEIFIVSNEPNNYRFLGFPVYSDIYSGVGALAGLHTILSYTKSDYVLALACDMPYLNPDLIGHMIESREKADIVIPALGDKGFLEPFRAIYSRTCLPSAELAILEGKRRAISFFDDLNVLELRSDVIHQFDPEEETFININTPKDYQRLVAKL
jgi:molybdopterin-guanine dinucleotide biosynthesis protein A